jgi:hypothetical protein
VCRRAGWSGNAISWGRSTSEESEWHERNRSSEASCGFPGPPDNNGHNCVGDEAAYRAKNDHPFGQEVSGAAPVNEQATDRANCGDNGTNPV